MDALAKAGFVDYESTASAVWVIEGSTHRKGRFPTVRLIDRASRKSPWSDFLVSAVVSARGHVTVTVDVTRQQVDAGWEVAAIIS
jgi:hypothetical protein